MLAALIEGHRRCVLCASCPKRGKHPFEPSKLFRISGPWRMLALRPLSHSFSCTVSRMSLTRISRHLFVATPCRVKSVLPGPKAFPDSVTAAQSFPQRGQYLCTSRFALGVFFFALHAKGFRKLHRLVRGTMLGSFMCRPAFLPAASGRNNHPLLIGHDGPTFDLRPH